jgi:hypothetical protein
MSAQPPPGVVTPDVLAVSVLLSLDDGGSNGFFQTPVNELASDFFERDRVGSEPDISISCRQ